MKFHECAKTLRDFMWFRNNQSEQHQDFAVLVLRLLYDNDNISTNSLNLNSAYMRQLQQDEIVESSPCLCKSSKAM